MRYSYVWTRILFRLHVLTKKTSNFGDEGYLYIERMFKNFQNFKHSLEDLNILLN